MVIQNVVFATMMKLYNIYFFECPFAKIIWRIVHMAFGIPPPKNVSNLFGGWLHGVHKIAKNQIRVGICALLWAMWHVRNDLIF
jgi:hypothetical protein